MYYKNKQLYKKVDSLHLYLGTFKAKKNGFNSSYFGHSCGYFHAGGGGLSYEVSRPAEEPPSTGTRYSPNTDIPPHVLMSSVSSHIEILQAKQQEEKAQELSFEGCYVVYIPQVICE